jgi:hypothetical protein
MGSAMVEHRIVTNIEINTPAVRIWALLTVTAWSWCTMQQVSEYDTCPSE